MGIQKNFLNRGKNYKPKFTQIIRFHLWKTSAVLKKDHSLGDYKYWEEMNWLSKEYYYPIKINLVQKILLRIILIIIRKKIKRAVQ